jgi:hypothetical protein
MELIGEETAHTYLQSTYYKVKQWIQRNESYNQIKICMCVKYIYIYVEWVKTWWKLNSTSTPWENISLYETWKFRENLGCTFFIIFHLDTCPFSFFLFSTAQAFFLQWNFLRDRNKNNGAFITRTKGMDEKYFWCLLLV